MSKFLLISPKNRTVYNFRGDLLKKIKSMGYDIVVTGPDQDNVDKILALGARFVVIPMDKNGTSVTGDLQYQANLESLIKQEKPDVVLSYTSKPVIYGGIAAKKAGVTNINALITGGGYTFTSTTPKAKALGKIVRALYRKSLKNTNHVIFQNHDDRAEFVSKHLVDLAQTNVVSGSGVNMQTFTPLPYPEGICFGMLSRFLVSKGVREYLEAARIVKDKYPQVRFLLLGKYETNMQDAVPQGEIEAFIKAGIIERLDETDDVRPFYAQTSVYVLPSHREGMPRTVLEAMACGRPIITTDTYGCRETIDAGKNGFLVPVKNAEQLAEAMEFFVTHPEQIELMGSASYDYCKQTFDVNVVNEAMCRYMGLTPSVDGNER